MNGRDACLRSRTNQFFGDSLACAERRARGPLRILCRHPAPSRSLIGECDAVIDLAGISGDPARRVAGTASRLRAAS